MKNFYWIGVAVSTVLVGLLPAALEPGVFSSPPLTHARLVLPHLALMLGHVLAGIALWLFIARDRKLRTTHLFVIAMVVEAVCAVFISLVGSDYSTSLLFATVMLSAGSYGGLYAFAIRRKAPGLATVVIVSTVLLSVVTVAVDQSSAIRTLARSLVAGTQVEETAAREANIVDSAFYPLRITEYIGRIPSSEVHGGGIQAIDGGLLLVTGDGNFYLLKVLGEDRVLESVELDLKAPLNREEFIRDAPSEVATEKFRVADVLYHERMGRDRIFVSHTYWKTDAQCYVMRVSMLTGSLTGVPFPPDSDQWQTLYESSPCITHLDIPEFSGHMIGGRMALLSDDELLVTVGDFGFGQGSVLLEDPESSYGKVLRIRTSDGTAEPFSVGHRNQQGLVVTEDGLIWATEHGPRGGDELNLIRQGQNYGWPLTTFGTAYDRHEWPELEGGVAEADTLQLPVYAWVPSIGISSLIESRSSRFPAWRGNLLVSSLKAKTLYRVHVEEGRAIVVEPIVIGGRIRDLAEDSEGRLIVWTDAESVLSIEPAEEGSDNALAFHTYCGGCHSADSDGNHGIGPDLGGVFGRKVASAPGYHYSGALEAMSAHWTEEELRAFLKNPRDYATGTTMAFRGLTNEQELDRTIAYLKSLQ